MRIPVIRRFNYSQPIIREFLMIIISLHVPKTAGTSLLLNFKYAYGDRAVQIDYDASLNLRGYSLVPIDLKKQSCSIPNHVKVIHGHFLPEKYNHIDPAFRLTFLRHPVQNIISIFFYWRKYIPSIPSLLFDDFKTQKFNILELARSPLIRYAYSNTLFGRFDMARFNFIGRYENLHEEYKVLSKKLGIILDSSIAENQTSPEGQDLERAELEANTRIIARLTDLLIEDIRFYDTYIK